MTQSLAEWLWWRFGRGHRGAQERWEQVSQIDKTYWEHEARAVRWAVEGGVTDGLREALERAVQVLAQYRGFQHFGYMHDFDRAIAKGRAALDATGQPSEEAP